MSKIKLTLSVAGDPVVLKLNLSGLAIGNFVTLDTEQEVTGGKVFHSLSLSGADAIFESNGENFYGGTATFNFQSSAAASLRAAIGLGTLATQSGTFSGTHSGSSSGTNTGDQDLSGYARLDEPNEWLQAQSFREGLNVQGILSSEDTRTESFSATGVSSYGNDATFFYGGVSASTHREALELGTLATQNGSFSGTSSGTNTGDQNLSGYAQLASTNTWTKKQTVTFTELSGTGLMVTAPSGYATGDNIFEVNKVSGPLLPLFYVMGTGDAVVAGSITAANLSGSNSGDQTSIAGIGGTKAQFNTACTDGDFAFLNSSNTFTQTQRYDSNSIQFIDNSFTVGGSTVTNFKTAFGLNDLAYENLGIRHSSVAKTANYTATSSDYTIRGNAASGGITIALPSAASAIRQILVIKKTDSSGNAVTVDANGSELIDGQLTMALVTQYSSVQVQSNGTGWDVLSFHEI